MSDSEIANWELGIDGGVNTPFLFPLLPSPYDY